MKAEREAREWSQATLAKRVVRAGFKSMSQVGIQKIEAKGNSQPKCIVQLAAALGLHARWLQTGKGEKYLLRPQQPDQPSERPLRPARTMLGQVSIAELEVYAPSGDGGDGERGNAIMANEEAGLIAGVHTMPADSFREAYGFTASRIRIVPVKGTSMVPELWPGQRVMVDIEDKAPSPPGVFVVWDGMALVMKYVEVIANSDPLRVRISSANPAFQAYERTLGEAYINGRVVGKWARM
ncbi:MAG: hypothetical protein K9G48_13830 [Reyranella sp.]|nr:hypothetical protein [Reyranella sp.]